MSGLKRLARPVLAAALLAGVAACGGGGDAAPDDAEARAAEAARHAYEKTILDWREQRLRSLQRPDGWLSLVGLHWLKPGTTFVGSAPDNGTRLALGPPYLGTLHVGKDGTLRLDIHPGAEGEVTVDGEPASGRVLLRSDRQAEKATVVGFNRGDASFIVIERGGRFALRVRDAMARTRTQFPGIAYFDIDPDYRFRARLEPAPAGATMEIIDVNGMVEKMPHIGRVHFEKDGKAYSLEAVDQGDGRLFFTFADRTSGHESYAAARFLYADPPGPDGLVDLDFNRAYNPPCAFTEFSTCPLPPPENRLDLRVTAGEKKPLPYQP
ncbi:DUF1684 domain-containing protein [Arenimonas fontis]|uniref:DUF1684 domain-containing protein n=1 Tax=Arenimonas fontis TaxID=2608255 RepID=A0A5B2ZA69_9GAMM|nr:DUF1684 domain-containing protein [Arenimonas fontis]KAA2285558.1 DUF1684 domain-containing protein [Arenimonas fontis]